MKKNKTVAEVNAALEQLDENVLKITTILLDIVRGDREWWGENMPMLMSQPLNSLKQHLEPLHDASLAEWQFNANGDLNYSVLEPIEALIWLAGLCRLDRILIGVLPRRFVDEIELQWKIIALYWVGCNA